MLYLYAISESPRPPDGTGLRGARVQAVGEEGPFALVSEHEELRLEAAQDDLWTHESVVEEAMAEGPVLPMRFGSSLADEDALLATLRQRRRDFEQGLERVRGAVELALRAVVELEDAPDEAAGKGIGGAVALTTAGPGTAYMLDRLGRRRLAEQVVARIDERLAPIARARTSRLSTDEQALLSAAYLVDRERAAAFQAQVERLEHELDGASITCTGPWPPYSFVAAEAES